MKIKTNAENRKDVVKAAAEILNTPSKYLGVPSCNFQVGNCIIDRAGTVETEDDSGRIGGAGIRGLTGNGRG